MKERLENRQFVIQNIIVLVGLLLLLKAAHLQIFDSTYRKKAEATTITAQTLYPSRGLLFDRNGRLLVQNEAIYDLQLTYDLFDPSIDTAKFCRLLNIDRKVFDQNININWKDKRYSKSLPFVFLKKIPGHIFTRFQESMHEFPGFTFVLRSARAYPHPHAAHVLGYISEVGQEEIDSKEAMYDIGDYSGTSGLEAYYEDYLRGQKGVSYVLKDNLGREVGSLKEGDLDSFAVSGNNIITSLDIVLQEYAEQLMFNKKGSIVAIEPATGEILTMVSAPCYDPNLLSVGPDRGAAYANLVEDTIRNPLFNRTMMAQYPPGSTLKPIFALIGLQEELITPKGLFTCEGGYKYNNYFWGCHAGPGVHNLTGAIQHSCNTYFYSLYRKLVEKHGFNNPGQGLNELKSKMQKFGLGTKLNVDIPNEQSGHIPDDDFYKKLYSSEGGRWYATYIISNGIGQGEIELTTIQMANLSAILANRGFYKTPHLLKERITTKNTPVLSSLQKNNVEIDEENFDPVIEGMYRAVTQGTAGLANVPGLEICGKTGTSENPHGENHSVFFAFAPKENPKIAIAVYIENAGWGGTYAAPIGSLLIEKYLNGKIAENRKWLEEKMLKANLLNVQKENSKG